MRVRESASATTVSISNDASFQSGGFNKLLIRQNVVLIHDFFHVLIAKHNVTVWCFCYVLTFENVAGYEQLKRRLVTEALKNSSSLNVQAQELWEAEKKALTTGFEKQIAELIERLRNAEEALEAKSPHAPEIRLSDVSAFFERADRQALIKQMQELTERLKNADEAKGGGM